MSDTNALTSREQRELGLKLFPGIPSLCKAIRADKCFDDLATVVRRHKEKVLAILLANDIPSEWAFFWSCEWPEDRHKLRKFVTGSWALDWSREWPKDRDKMRKFVTSSWIAFCWSREWPEERDKLPR